MTTDQITEESTEQKAVQTGDYSCREVPLEISARDLLRRRGGSFLAIDMRDAASCAYGMMEGALQISESALMAYLEHLPGREDPHLPDREDPACTEESSACRQLSAALASGMPIVLYCKYGLVSRDAARAFREKGWRGVCSLAGGYGRWALEESYRAAQDEDRRGDIEKSLRKAFKHDLVGRFEKAVVQYGLVEEGDRIAVCISGGKDSMLMAKLFQELKRHNKFPFSLVFLCMDPGYNAANRRRIEDNAGLLRVPVRAPRLLLRLLP